MFKKYKDLSEGTKKHEKKENIMKKYALIGHPLGHSLSPQIHTRLMELIGVTGEYEKLDIPPEELEKSYEKLSALDGFNVTIPHKVGIIPYCDKLDDSAARFGSVNCVKNAGEKIGYNTDVIGFERSIEMLGASLASRVLVIGCGGVGRMMAAQAAFRGGKVTVAVLADFYADAEKTIAGIKEKMPDADISAVKISSDTLSLSDLKENTAFDLLVNASPVGMFPNTEKMPCTEELLHTVAAVFDVIYNPKETMLYKAASNRHIPAMTGMAMLVLQAAAAQEIWNGVKFAEADLKQLIEDMEKLV